MTIFVDKVIPNDLGGITNDLKKAEYILAVHKTSFEEILNKMSINVKIPSGMFGSGKYIIAFNFTRDLSKINFGIINSNIDLNKNFDAFADSFSPKSVAGFYKIQQQLRLKKDSEKTQIELSDNYSDFIKAYGEYIEHRKME